MRPYDDTTSPVPPPLTLPRLDQPPFYSSSSIDTISSSTPVKSTSSPIDYNGSQYYVERQIGFGRSCDDVTSCYCATNKTQPRIAIKAEKRDEKTKRFLDGPVYQREAAWWNIVYGANTAALLGDPQNQFVQHKLLMPLLPGETLTRIRYQSLCHLVLHIIAAAIAIQKLHAKGAVHRDLTTNNMLAETNTETTVSLIDFEVTEKIGAMVPIEIPHTNDQQKTIECNAPETYSFRLCDEAATVKVGPAEDYFRFGYVIFDLFNFSVNRQKYFSADQSDSEKLKYVIAGLKAPNPALRWNMQKTISVLHCLFIATRPEAPLSQPADVVQKIKDHRKMLQDENSKKDNVTKQEKIDGLLFILHATTIMPLQKTIAESKTIFPELTQGFFSSRTEKMLKELAPTATPAL